MNRNAILSPRETEVAELLAWGAAKKEVADHLTISTRTVENTARNIYEKVGIQKATELCVWWFCTHCGVSFEMSPIKRTMSIIILLVFFHSNVIEAKESKRYYQSRTRNERTVCRRFCRDEDINGLDYLLN
jgi:DNA-binding CsgD family transcriptional regulator